MPGGLKDPPRAGFDTIPPLDKDTSNAVEKSSTTRSTAIEPTHIDRVQYSTLETSLV